MKEVFIPYELAQELKKKGYPMPTKIIYATYKQDGKLCPMKIVGEPVCKEPVAPTIEQVLKWLRKKHAIHLEIKICDGGWYCDVWYYEYYEYYEYEREYSVKRVFELIDYASYEQAALAGIKYVLENLI